MVSLNQLSITGNITASPELKDIGEGDDACVVEGLIIHNWRLRIDAGSKALEKRALIPFKIYGKAARRFAETVTPKVNVLLSGHLETDEWKDGDQPRSRTFLYVSSFQYNSPKANSTETAKT